MRRARRESAASGLGGLCERVERWRAQRSGGGGGRVPEELWDAAVEVARVEGVHATAKRLRFNYQSLKDRLDRGKHEASGETKAEMTPFVEVEIPALGSTNRDGKTVVELVGRRGERMRIDVTGASTVDVVGLAQAFWSHAP